MTRTSTVEQLAGLIAAVRRQHPVRVAIDGIDAAGKTTLADELVGPLRSRGRTVIRASLDGFHRSRRERYRRGEASAEGYYHDSFDYESLRSALLRPLGPEGSRLYRPAVFDHRSDAPLDAPSERAPDDAVLLLDGIFLLRPELEACWDYCVFVDVTFETALRRAMSRDQPLFGPAEAVEQRYRQRYLPAQRRYLARVRPRERADAVIDNNVPAGATLLLNQDRGGE